VIRIALHDLLVVGALILGGTLAGRILGRLRFPTVTSYMLLGLVMGPAALGILAADVIDELQIVLDIALGLIMFHVGGQLDFGKRGRERFRLALRLGGVECLLSWALILGALLLVGAPPELALPAAAITCSSSPAVILLVVRQFGTKGPVTDGLLSAAAANNALSFLIFVLTLPYLHAQAGATGTVVAVHPLYLLTGSALLGALLGVGLGWLEDRFPDRDHFLLRIGTVLLAIGGARTLALSPLATALAVGSGAVTMARHRRTVTEFGRAEQPFFVLLFVLAGARLHLGDLFHAGLFGLVLVAARIAAKTAGGFLGGVSAGYEPRTAAWLGVGLTPLAGMAIGLTGLFAQLYPVEGGQVATLVLAAVAVFEAIGPPLTELAMIRTGEIEPGKTAGH
jgi:Kef-type K+ transport system membrane component KefB